MWNQRLTLARVRMGLRKQKTRAKLASFVENKNLSQTIAAESLPFEMEPRTRQTSPAAIGTEDRAGGGIRPTG